MQRTRGDIAEGVVLGLLVKHGLSVLVPFRHDVPYDLVVHLPDDRFIRVQCKAGIQQERCVVFNSAATDHGQGRKDYRGRADVFGVYCPTLDRAFIVPVEEAATRRTWLSLAPARNGQQRRVRDAEDFTLEAWATHHVTLAVPA